MENERIIAVIVTMYWLGNRYHLFIKRQVISSDR